MSRESAIFFLFCSFTANDVTRTRDHVNVDVVGVDGAKQSRDDDVDEDRNPALGDMACCDLDGCSREQCECKRTARSSSNLLNDDNGTRRKEDKEKGGKRVEAKAGVRERQVVTGKGRARTNIWS